MKKSKKTKKPQRKFYLSRLMVTVLSEDAPLSGDIELKDVDYAMTDGDCVGEVELTSAYRINRKDVVHTLKSMNSRPEFFGLDDKGRDLP